MTIVYEPEYAITGWLDNNGYRELSWFCRDLTNDVPLTLTFLAPIFIDDPDVIYLLTGPGTPIPQYPPGAPPLAGITVQLLAGFFDDPDGYFTPIAIRTLKQSDAMLKNEVRRIR